LKIYCYESLSRYLVATQVDILETLDVGFRFDSLLTTRDDQTDREVSRAIAQGLFAAFESTPEMDDAMLEAPATWVDLSALERAVPSWNLIAQSINRLAPSVLSPFYTATAKSAAVEQAVSSRYLNHLRSASKSPLAIEILTRNVRAASHSPADRDLGALLNAIEPSMPATQVPTLVDLRQALGAAIQVFGGSPVSPKSGLTVHWFDPTQGNSLPRLERSESGIPSSSYTSAN
jgi:cell wall-associated NlpC family hydrolase